MKCTQQPLLMYYLLIDLYICIYIGKSRISIARAGLIGKIHLTSEMNQEEAATEVRQCGMMLLFHSLY